MTSDVNAPLPCPFCGADGEALTMDGDRWHQSVYCNGCETSGPTKSVPHGLRPYLVTDADTQRAADEAVAAWNQRATGKSDG